MKIYESSMRDFRFRGPFAIVFIAALQVAGYTVAIRTTLGGDPQPADGPPYFLREHNRQVEVPVEIWQRSKSLQVIMYVSFVATALTLAATLAGYFANPTRYNRHPDLGWIVLLTMVAFFAGVNLADFVRLP